MCLCSSMDIIFLPVQCVRSSVRTCLYASRINIVSAISWKVLDEFSQTLQQRCTLIQRRMLQTLGSTIEVLCHGGRKYGEKALLSLHNIIYLATRWQLSSGCIIYNAYILPIFLNGSEVWSVISTLSKKIDVLDDWCFRRTLHIYWTDFVSNRLMRFGLALDNHSCLTLYVDVACPSSYISAVMQSSRHAIALPRDTLRHFLLPRPCLGLELSASASPRPRRLLLKFASKWKLWLWQFLW